MFTMWDSNKTIYKHTNSSIFKPSNLFFKYPKVNFKNYQHYNIQELFKALEEREDGVFAQYNKKG